MKIYYLQEINPTRACPLGTAPATEPEQLALQKLQHWRIWHSPTKHNKHWALKKRTEKTATLAHLAFTN
jgi:hypothetical protein